MGTAVEELARFTNPDALDLGRDPNRHLSFGMGIHYRLGAPLARLETAVALRNVLDRLPRLRLARPAEPLRWGTGFLMRGVKELPVTC